MSSTNEHVPDDSQDEGGKAASGTAAEAGAADIDRLRAELEAAQAQVAEHLDRFLRAKAEADNTRKRTEVEVANSRKYAVESFAAEMLAVHDSLDLARSVSLVDNAVAVEKMHEGLELTLKLMDGVLAKFGVTQTDPKGEKFDPARHQALGMVESADVPPNHVVTVVQKGYLLRDRLLRPAMVIVAKAPDPQTPDK
ncbi:MAG: nucleotide exchange factor GrpE [Pseudomonadota bacterium]